MEEITKHINDTNASYRSLNAGDAKNTDLFLDNEHYQLFKDCGEQITVRYHKTNLSQAILFISSILPRKFDLSATHTIINYSNDFVKSQLEILNALFVENGKESETFTQIWNLRKNVLKKNGEIDSRFYFNGLIKDVDYINANGEKTTAKFSIRNYLAGGYSNLLIKKSYDGFFDIFITNSTTPYDDGKEIGCEIIDSETNNNILQQIVYGAPGTGKSRSVKDETKPYEDNNRVFRTTFHPDSDYSTFVGAYKPTTELVQKYYDGQPLKDIDGNPITEKVITYEFVQQVFLQAYVAAWKDRSQRVYLVIEEINRGNCAQIFGDLFQLLDRGENGYSEYPIRADKDLQNTLKAAFADVEIDDYPKIKSGVEMLLPDNFYIRATMNTSDQSLFPIDSAFKRRWDWKYTPISKVENKPFIIKVDDDNYSWWKFLCSINKEISTTTYSEDKKLGYFFCNSYDGIISANTFVNKVVFYLWNDVFKDYGFSNEFFNDPNDTEDDKLSFNKFFITNGEANTATIKQFFSNLGLKPINQDDNEIEEDDEDKKQGRDTTRYSINGNGSFTKKYLGYEMIKLYVEARANVTVEDVIKEWYDLSRVNRFVENQADYETRTEDGKTRAQSIQCADGLVWVTTNGWIPETIDELIANVNDKNWGIKVEKIA